MVMGYPTQPDEPDQPKHAKDYPAEELVPNTPEVSPTPGLGGTEPPLKQDDLVVVKKFGVPYKAIIGFFTVFIGQILARVTVNDIPVFPDTTNGWISLIGGSAFAAFLIYFKGNVYTVPQAQKILNKAEKKAA